MEEALLLLSRSTSTLLLLLSPSNRPIAMPSSSLLSAASHFRRTKADEPATTTAATRRSSSRSPRQPRASSTTTAAASAAASRLPFALRELGKKKRKKLTSRSQIAFFFRLVLVRRLSPFRLSPFQEKKQNRTKKNKKNAVRCRESHPHLQEKGPRRARARARRRRLGALGALCPRGANGRARPCRRRGGSCRRQVRVFCFRPVEGTLFFYRLLFRAHLHQKFHFTS